MGRAHPSDTYYEEATMKMKSIETAALIGLVGFTGFLLQATIAACRAFPLSEPCIGGFGWTSVSGTLTSLAVWLVAYRYRWGERLISWSQRDQHFSIACLAFGTLCLLLSWYTYQGWARPAEEAGEIWWAMRRIMPTVGWVLLLVVGLYAHLGAIVSRVITTFEDRDGW